MPVPFQNLIPFMGIVQSDTDPTPLGRMKVRCFGFHPPHHDDSVSNDHLPWAVKLDNTVGALESPDPKPGELVFGFFLDGRDAQFPVVIGSLPSFAQGSLVNPWSDSTPATVDRSPRAPGQPHHTGLDVEATAAAAAKGAAVSLKSATGESTVHFPPPDVGGTGGSSINGSSYGGSHVYAGGHVTMFHGTGSVIQISEAGDVVIQGLKDSYYTTLANSAERVDGTKNIMVQGKYNIRVQGNCNLTVNGHMNHTVAGDYNIRVGGKYNVLAGEQVELQGAKAGLHGYSESVNITSATDLLVSSGANIALFAAGNLGAYIDGEVDVLSTGDLRVSSDGNLELAAEIGLQATGKGIVNILSNGIVNIEGSGGIEMLGDGDINIQGGPNVNLNNGADGALEAAKAAPDQTNTPARTDLGDPPAGTTIPADPINLGGEEDNYLDKDASTQTADEDDGGGIGSDAEVEPVTTPLEEPVTEDTAVDSATPDENADGPYIPPTDIEADGPYIPPTDIETEPYFGDTPITIQNEDQRTVAVQSLINEASTPEGAAAVLNRVGITQTEQGLVMSDVARFSDGTIANLTQTEALALNNALTQSTGVEFGFMSPDQYRGLLAEAPQIEPALTQRDSSGNAPSSSNQFELINKQRTQYQPGIPGVLRVGAVETYVNDVYNALPSATRIMGFSQSGGTDLWMNGGLSHHNLNYTNYAQGQQSIIVGGDINNLTNLGVIIK